MGLTLETLPLHTAGITCFASYAPGGDFCINPLHLSPAQRPTSQAMGEAGWTRSLWIQRDGAGALQKGMLLFGERLHGERRHCSWGPDEWIGASWAEKGDHTNLAFSPIFPGG